MKTATTKRPVTDVAREIARDTHRQAYASKMDELATHHADYLRIVATIATGQEPTPEENDQLGHAMEKLGYLDSDGAALASDAEVLHRLETAFPSEMKDEVSYRKRCQELWKATCAAADQIEPARAALTKAIETHRLAEIQQETFEAQYREKLNLKKFNARLFGDLEKAIDPDAPNVGIRVEKIRQYADTHRMPSKMEPNYISNRH